MLHKTKLKLAAAHQHCLSEEKSTEYTLQYLQDMCNVDLDCVLAYMELDEKIHKMLFEEVNTVLNTVIKIEDSILFKKT